MKKSKSKQSHQLHQTTTSAQSRHKSNLPIQHESCSNSSEIEEKERDPDDQHLGDVQTDAILIVPLTSPSTITVQSHQSTSYITFSPIELTNIPIDTKTIPNQHHSSPLHQSISYSTPQHQIATSSSLSSQSSLKLRQVFIHHQSSSPQQPPLSTKTVAVTSPHLASPLSTSSNQLRTSSQSLLTANPENPAHPANPESLQNSDNYDTIPQITPPFELQSNTSFFVPLQSSTNLQSFHNTTPSILPLTTIPASTSPPHIDSPNFSICPRLSLSNLSPDENALKQHQYELLLSQSQLSRLDTILRSTPTFQPTSSQASSIQNDAPSSHLPISLNLNDICTPGPDTPPGIGTGASISSNFQHQNDQNTLYSSSTSSSHHHHHQRTSSTGSIFNLLQVQQHPTTDPQTQSNNSRYQKNPPSNQANSPRPTLFQTLSSTSIASSSSTTTPPTANISLWKQQLKHPELLQTTFDQHPALISSPLIHQSFPTQCNFSQPEQPKQLNHSNQSEQPVQQQEKEQNPVSLSSSPQTPPVFCSNRPQICNANSNSNPVHNLNNNHVSTNKQSTIAASQDPLIPTTNSPKKLSYTTGGVFYNPQQHKDHQLDKPRNLWCVNYQGNRFSWAEIQLHVTIDDCWLVVQNDVYDVSQMISQHPGGEQTILKFAGTAVDRHYLFHSQEAHKIWEQCRIGIVHQSNITHITGGGSGGCPKTSPDLCTIM